MRFNILIFLFVFQIFSAQNSTINKVDRFTNETVTYELVSKYSDGTLMSKDKTDGIIYITENNKFYKRVLVDERINVKWFGAKGDANINDIGTDDTNNIENAITILSKIYKRQNMTGGNVFGGFTLYFPRGIYLINKTMILPDGCNILGESKTATVIHAIKPRFIFTNIRGMADNKVDVLMSQNFSVRNLTLKQGGLELQNAVSSTIEDVRIMNLFGNETDTGILVKIPVNLYVSNVQIYNSSGTGIIYSDNAGAGPSTTATFDRLAISHCKTGMIVDGNTGGSHAILTSKIYNSIIEYNEVGLVFLGNVENFAVRDTHFEQNKTSAITIAGNVTITLDNVWGDNLGDIVVQNSINPKSKINLNNVNIPVKNTSSFRGVVTTP